MCDAVMRFGCGNERGVCGAGEMEGSVFVVCALMRALAGTAGLPCMLHLPEAMFRVWRRLSAPRRTCCNAIREFLNVDGVVQLWRRV